MCREENDAVVRPRGSLRTCRISRHHARSVAGRCSCFCRQTMAENGDHGNYHGGSSSNWFGCDGRKLARIFEVRGYEIDSKAPGGVLPQFKDCLGGCHLVREFFPELHGIQDDQNYLACSVDHSSANREEYTILRPSNLRLQSCAKECIV